MKRQCGAGLQACDRTAKAVRRPLRGDPECLTPWLQGAQLPRPCHGQRICQLVKYSAVPQVTRRVPAGTFSVSPPRLGSNVIARL
jgi:hypothetical protein